MRREPIVHWQDLLEEVHEGTSRSIIRSKIQCLRAREYLRDARHDIRRRASPFVNGLILVAYEEDVSRENQFQQLQLERVRVLRFINLYVFLRIARANFGVRLKEIDCLEHQGVKIEPTFQS